jgi:hypothetical protein
LRSLAERLKRVTASPTRQISSPLFISPKLPPEHHFIAHVGLEFNGGDNVGSAYHVDEFWKGVVFRIEAGTLLQGSVQNDLVTRIKAISF